jgi:hypothetical protein
MTSIEELLVKQPSPTEPELEHEIQIRDALVQATRSEMTTIQTLLEPLRAAKAAAAAGPTHLQQTVKGK